MNECLQPDLNMFEIYKRVNKKKIDEEGIRTLAGKAH